MINTNEATVTGAPTSRTEEMLSEVDSLAQALKIELNNLTAKLTPALLPETPIKVIECTEQGVPLLDSLDCIRTELKQRVQQLQYLQDRIII